MHIVRQCYETPYVEFQQHVDIIESTNYTYICAFYFTPPPQKKVKSKKSTSTSKEKGLIQLTKYFNNNIRLVCRHRHSTRHGNLIISISEDHIDNGYNALDCYPILGAHFNAIVASSLCLHIADT